MIARKVVMGTLALMLTLPLAAHGQEVMPYPQLQTAAPQASYAPQQIDQLTAQIALYPDPLVAQILMASTYPLEVVEASRWLQNSQNAQLQGDQLAAALAQQPWDPSVKSLVNFPQILSMMDNNLQWTEQLGDAFLAQQADVMNSVQRMRQMAEAAGHLNSTLQQTISNDAGAIEIEPANPDTVYVPYYNPADVYGAWPYPDYQPYYFAPPPEYYYPAYGVIGFGAGVALIDVLWGWDRWDWRNHRIDIDNSRFAEINRGHPPVQSGVWEHDPAHRHGVPYATPAARAQFQGAAAPSRRNFRGFAPRSNVAAPASVQPGPAVRESTSVRPAVASAPVNEMQPRQEPRMQPQATPRVQPQMQQRQAPVFESFSRGPEVRAQAQRGAYSRSTMPSAPVRSAPVRNNAPRGNGSGRNDNTRSR